MIIFRLPFDKDYYINSNNNNTKNSVEFVSFDKKTYLKFDGDLKKLSPMDFAKKNFQLPKNPFLVENETKEEYLEKIERTIDFIKVHQLKKIVIARKKNIDFQDINIFETCQNLVKSYPSAFVYVFQKGDIFWIGAFSELLGKYDKKTHFFETMSLAGTLPIDEDWTEKEIEEQKPVTEYISNILKIYSENVEISETKDHISGNIKHLRTDFKTQISERSLDDLINDLHPTPAVCGVPKSLCISIIQDIEGFDRSFYAGYSKVDINDTIFYFVNLRCGRLFKNNAELFVGGGITALSSPEKEWRETELKADALMNNIK